MGIEWQAIIGAAIGIVIKHLFPGLIPSQPTTPQPALPAPPPVNNTPRVEDVLSLLLTELRRLHDRLDLLRPGNASNPTGPA